MLITDPCGGVDYGGSRAGVAALVGQSMGADCGRPALLAISRYHVSDDRGGGLAAIAGLCRDFPVGEGVGRAYLPHLAHAVAQSAGISASGARSRAPISAFLTGFRDLGNPKPSFYLACCRRC